jgi:hypothetical protein
LLERNVMVGRPLFVTLTFFVGSRAAEKRKTFDLCNLEEGVKLREMVPIGVLIDEICGVASRDNDIDGLADTLRVGE